MLARLAFCEGYHGESIPLFSPGFWRWLVTLGFLYLADVPLESLPLLQYVPSSPSLHMTFLQAHQVYWIRSLAYSVHSLLTQT